MLIANGKRKIRLNDKVLGIQNMMEVVWSDKLAEEASTYLQKHVKDEFREGPFVKTDNGYKNTLVALFTLNHTLPMVRPSFFELAVDRWFNPWEPSAYTIYRDDTYKALCPGTNEIGCYYHLDIGGTIVEYILCRYDNLPNLGCSHYLGGDFQAGKPSCGAHGLMDSPLWPGLCRQKNYKESPYQSTLPPQSEKPTPLVKKKDKPHTYHSLTQSVLYGQPTVLKQPGYNPPYRTGKPKIKQ